MGIPERHQLGGIITSNTVCLHNPPSMLVCYHTVPNVFNSISGNDSAEERRRNYLRTKRRSIYFYNLIVSTASVVSTVAVDFSPVDLQTFTIVSCSMQTTAWSVTSCHHKAHKILELENKDTK